MDQTLMRMLELSYNGYYCSQILLLLALEAQGKCNPDLVRAMGGLANGHGADTGTCGILTGAACLLSLYAGKGSDDEQEDEELKYLLRDLTDWFELTIGGRFGGTGCATIVGDRSEVRQRCGAITAETYAKVQELLLVAGYDLTEGKRG